MSVTIQSVERAFTLRKCKPALAAIALLAVTQGFFFQVSEVAQESVRHVVSLKRSWAIDEGYIRRDPSKLLVFFMGGSRITGGVVPQVFDEETGITHSYNVSLPGMPLASHYFWLKDYLSRRGSHASPDYILIDPSDREWQEPHFMDYALANAGVAEVFHYFLATGNAGLLVNYFVPLRFQWPEVRRYLKSKFYSSSPAIFQDRFLELYESKYALHETYKHDWEYLFRTQFVAPEAHWLARRKLLEDTRGYYDFRELSAKEGPPAVERFPGRRVPPPPAAASAYLKKFMDLTAKHGIKVVLIDDYAPPAAKTAPRVIRTLPPEEPREGNHVVVAPEALKKKRFDAEFFSDPLHLNVKGAAEFSRHLAGIFARALPGPEAEADGVKKIDRRGVPE